MNRCLKWVGATAALALTGCVSAQQPLSNVCNPGFSSFSFGVNSTWLLDVGPQGCTSTLNLSGGAVIASSIVKPARNGAAFVQGTTWGYTPSASYRGPDQFVMSLTGGGFAGTATSLVTVQVRVVP
jgi:hypothetical protein